MTANACLCCAACLNELSSWFGPFKICRERWCWCVPYAKQASDRGECKHIKCTIHLLVGAQIANHHPGGNCKVMTTTVCFCRPMNIVTDTKLKHFAAGGDCKGVQRPSPRFVTSVQVCSSVITLLHAEASCSSWIARITGKRQPRLSAAASDHSMVMRELRRTRIHTPTTNPWPHRCTCCKHTNSLQPSPTPDLPVGPLHYA